MNSYEKQYVSKGYKLPQGYTWELIHAGRKQWDISERMVPVGSANGICAWGVPIFKS